MKSPRILKSVLVVSALLAAAAAQDGMAASTYTDTFALVTSNAGVNLGEQFTLVVEQTAGGASFTLTNNIGTASSITDIYFNQAISDMFSSMTISGESAGVDYSMGARPANLPGSGIINFHSGYSADSNAPVPENGLNNAGEWISFMGLFANGQTFDALIASLVTAGGVGLHVQSIATSGNSDSYVNNGGPGNVTSVPLPAAAWLFGSTLLGFAGLGSRGKKVLAQGKKVLAQG